MDFLYDPGHIVIYPGKIESDRGKEKTRIRLIVPTLAEYTARHIALLEQIDTALATEREENQLVLEQRRTEAAFADMIYQSALDCELQGKLKKKFGKSLGRLIAAEFEPDNPIAEYVFPTER